MKKPKLITSLVLSLMLTTSIGVQASQASTTNANSSQVQMTQEQSMAMKAEEKQMPAKEKKFKELQQQILKNMAKGIAKDKVAETSNSISTPAVVTATAVPSDYPTRPGVILLTTDANFIINHGHVGIILSSDTTVESKLSTGVQRFANTWTTRYSDVEAGSVSDTSASEDVTAANWCDDQVGKPYNKSLWDTTTRSKFSCSSLVWASFMDNFDINLDDDGGIIWPYDIGLSENLSLFFYWEE